MFVSILFATTFNPQEAFEKCKLIKASYDAYYLYEKEKKGLTSSDSKILESFPQYEKAIPFNDASGRRAGCVFKKGKYIDIACHGSINEIDWYINAGVCMRNLYLGKELVGKAHVGFCLKVDGMFGNLTKILLSMIEDDSIIRFSGHIHNSDDSSVFITKRFIPEI